MVLTSGTKEQMSYLCYHVTECKRAHSWSWHNGGYRHQIRAHLGPCLYLRSRLGIGWRRGANRCCVPAVMSSHGERKRTADRVIRKSQSKKILRYSGVFLPVGSGMYINILCAWIKLSGNLSKCQCLCSSDIRNTQY